MVKWIKKQKRYDHLFIKNYGHLTHFILLYKPYHIHRTARDEKRFPFSAKTMPCLFEIFSLCLKKHLKIFNHRSNIANRSNRSAVIWISLCRLSLQALEALIETIPEKCFRKLPNHVSFSFPKQLHLQSPQGDTVGQHWHLMG